MDNVTNMENNIAENTDNMVNNMVGWLTINELATRCGVSLTTIYKWVGEGKLVEPTHFGRNIRWREQDVVTVVKEAQSANKVKRAKARAAAVARANKVVLKRGRPADLSNPTDKYNRYRESHNKARQEKYHADTAYRRKQLENSRTRYRELRGGCANIALIDPVEIAAAGTLRNVISPGKWLNKAVITFSATELAKVLGNYATMVVYRWMSNNWLPQMRYKARALDNPSNGLVSVYTIEEVMAVTNLLHTHQTTVSCKFGSQYMGLVKRIRDAVEMVNSRTFTQ